MPDNRLYTNSWHTWQPSAKTMDGKVREIITWAAGRQLYACEKDVELIEALRKVGEKVKTGVFCPQGSVRVVLSGEDL